MKSNGERGRRTPRPYDAEGAKSRLAKCCATRERCARDLQVYLARLGATAQEAAGLIAWLEQEGFLCEARYARAFARDKSRFAGWGPLKIRAALRQKGIPPQDVADALEEVAEAEESPDLEALLAKKLRSLGGQEPYMKAKGKLVRFAASRGFAAEQTYRAVDQVLRDYPRHNAEDEY